MRLKKSLSVYYYNNYVTLLLLPLILFVVLQNCKGAITDEDYAEINGSLPPKESLYFNMEIFRNTDLSIYPNIIEDSKAIDPYGSFIFARDYVINNISNVILDKMNPAVNVYVNYPAMKPTIMYNGDFLWEYAILGYNVRLFRKEITDGFNWTLRMSDDFAVNFKILDGYSNSANTSGFWRFYDLASAHQNISSLLFSLEWRISQSAGKNLTLTDINTDICEGCRGNTLSYKEITDPSNSSNDLITVDYYNIHKADYDLSSTSENIQIIWRKNSTYTVHNGMMTDGLTSTVCWSDILTNTSCN